MDFEKYSTKNVINKSIASCNGVYRKVLVASIIQYVAFLATYILTQSMLLSFIVYLVFVPAQAKFLADMKNENINDVFKVKSKFGNYLILSMFFAFVFGILSILLIFPAIIFLANYALVFEVAGKENMGLMESLKTAKEKAKGYRGKLAWLCVVFMFILLLLVGFCLLISWLLSLALPTLTGAIGLMFGIIAIPSFYFVGAFTGISLFLIFVFPIQLICFSNAAKAMESDKKYMDQVANEVLKKETKEETVQQENAEESKEKEDNKEDGNPADYIC